ncbi:MAG: Uma2 family endonuclease [Calothrix sp. FI2-JRJ7]|nr:Uma2 family endonuclease [Calothrix sp. FI2-JRJ7]
MLNVAFVSESFKNFSLSDWMQNPLDDTEWVNGELVEKNCITLKHSQVQSKLARQWGNYKDSSGLGGEVYTDVPCLTNIQGRRPDVTYLTPDLVSQYGNQKVLPQSFPLSAEIVSPTDYAEEVIAKTAEYLHKFHI